MSLIRLTTEFDTFDAAFLEAVCQSTKNVLYITTRKTVSFVSETFLDCLRNWYDVVASIQPTLNVVPLLEVNGWKLRQIAEEKHDLGVMWTSRPFLDEDHAFLKQLNRYREAKGLKDVMLLESPSSGSQMNTPSTTDIGEKILFDSVVVGGTFDRLHAGHRLLLSTCVLITRQRLMVGMTDGFYLERKRYREQIQSFDERKTHVESFLRSIQRDLMIEFVTLHDPLESVKAETDPNLQSIVVSEETVQGAHTINDKRHQNKIPELAVVVVKSIGGEGTSKLSSTSLRKHSLM